MRFYSFGPAKEPVILLLPGTCCHWARNFGHVIPLLSQDFHVVCASYDGFDEAEDATFPDMRTEVGRIEHYIRGNFEGRIRAAYGCSLGGSVVGLLVKRGRIHIDHAILGSSDLDQSGKVFARLQAWLISKVLYGMFQTGKLPAWMQRRLNEKSPEDRAYMDEMLRMFGLTHIGADADPCGLRQGCGVEWKRDRNRSTDMGFVRRESIRNQFYSDLVTPLEDGICVPGTTVHIFYALKMGAKYEARYRRHFKAPDIRRHDLQHEELLLCRPGEWMEEVKRCLEVEHG